MNAILILCFIIIIILIVIFANLRDNGDTINEARNNNSKSKDINRRTGVIIDELSKQNNSAINIARELEAGNKQSTELNSNIREANKTAGDIIRQVRKQKLD